MEIKVKEVGVVEEKSVQQVEQELLEKHEEKLSGEVESEETTEVVAQKETEEEEDTAQPSELNEESVLSFIKDKYGREINSLDEITAAQEI